MDHALPSIDTRCSGYATLSVACLSQYGRPEPGDRLVARAAEGVAAIARGGLVRGSIDGSGETAGRTTDGEPDPRQELDH